jgi:rRNA maturation endonuclease Nob1
MEKMSSLTKKSAIALDYAVLCLDCNCVSDANRECPACGSRALMNLSTVLDRREEFADARELAVA